MWEYFIELGSVYLFGKGPGEKGYCLLMNNDLQVLEAKMASFLGVGEEGN